MDMKPPIDTVTFDLWNTLLIHNEDYDRDIRSLRSKEILDALGRCGLRVAAADVERAYRLSDLRLSERWSDHRDMGLDEQLSVFLECMDLQPTPELVGAIDRPYADVVLKMKPVVIEGALEAVQEMKERGYKVALISNTGRTPGRAMRKVLDGYGFAGLFEVATFSNEEGYKKPHPEIFRRTLLQLNSKPERAVHVGDHGLLDVLGARDAGMRSVHVTRYAPAGDCFYMPDIAIERISELPGAMDALARE
jgi:HAD superfamily hydrolase (TIGR01509 family)